MYLLGAQRLERLQHEHHLVHVHRLVALPCPLSLSLQPLLLVVVVHAQRSPGREVRGAVQSPLPAQRFQVLQDQRQDQLIHEIHVYMYRAERNIDKEQHTQGGESERAVLLVEQSCRRTCCFRRVYSTCKKSSAQLALSGST